MYTIIKHGKPEYRVFICEKCGCEFSCVESDCKVIYDTGCTMRAGYTMSSKRPICPDCGALCNEWK